MDLVAVFRGEQVQVEHVDVDIGQLQGFAGDPNSRKVFDISPGQVPSLRVKPQISNTRDGIEGYRLAD
jgi:hypothetical protein